MLQLTPLDTPPPTTPSKSSVVDAGLSSSVSGSIRITGERVGAGRGTVVLTIVLRPVVLSFSFCFSLRFSLGITLTQRMDSRHKVGTTSSWENLLVLLVESKNLRGNKLSLMVKSINTRIGKNLLLVVKTVNLGLVDLVEGVDSIGDGSFLVVSKSSLKSMVLDLGSLDAGGVLGSNSTIGVSYKS